MKIIESILTKNPCYTAGRKITVKGLMLHSIGCAQPKASVLVEGWNKETYTRACVHAFIDGNTGEVYQTLPWDHRGAHAGGAANNTHIGVEMCEPSYIKYNANGTSFTDTDLAKARASVAKTYEAAVELFAFLCKQFNLDPLADGVIISHAEGYARGIASNHGDPVHLWKGLGMNYTMNTFRQAVKDTLNTAETKYYIQLGESIDKAETEALLEKLKELVSSSRVIAKEPVIKPIEESSKPTEQQNKNNGINLPTLVRGNKGTAVRTLQVLLNANGATLTADGSFGPASEKAVKAFQTEKKLIVDGICGPATWKALLLA
jgi:hypothetical protein